MDLDFDILDDGSDIEVEVLEENVVEDVSDEFSDEMKQLFGSDSEKESPPKKKKKRKSNADSKKSKKRKLKRKPSVRRRKKHCFPLKTKYKKFVFSQSNLREASKSIRLRKVEDRKKQLARVKRENEKRLQEETESKLRHIVNMHQFDQKEFNQDAAVVERGLKKYEQDMVDQGLENMPKADVKKVFTIQGEVYRPLGAHFHYKDAGLSPGNFEMYRVPCKGKLQCCHCTLPIQGVPLPLPISYSEKLDVFRIKLQFCSASCIFGFAAQEFSLNDYPKKTPIIYYMLHKVYGFDITKKIPKAPPPFGILKRYGGYMTDANWRKNVANLTRKTEVHSFPLIPHRWGTADIHRVSVSVRDENNDYDIVKDYVMRIVDKNIWNLNLDACDLLSTVEGISHKTGKRKRQAPKKPVKRKPAKPKTISFSCFEASDEKDGANKFNITDLENDLKSVEDAVRLRNPRISKNSKSIMQYMIKTKK
jgi:hypothetical protein